MKTKYEIVHELKNVKLIIGNGFDLQCHLKTSYSDYFLFDKPKLKILGEWIEKFQNNAKSYLNFRISNNKSFWIDLNNFADFNVWDVFFYLISYQNKEISNWKWCDIESSIAEYLADRQYPQKDALDFNFEIICNTLVNGETKYSLSDKALIIASFIYKKRNERKFNNKKEFYVFLLSQLKIFEHNFGKYIYSQHFKHSNNGFVSSNENYKIESRKTLEKLCTLKNLTSVDTFNYDTPECIEIESIIHNINGTTEYPIFGIDSDTFSAPDPRYIFTKTSRRLEFEIFHKEVEPSFDYENIIIFGCSLSKADYNYFFYIFDKLDIANVKNTSKIVFSYSIYDVNKSDIIHKKLEEDVFMLFQEYSKYKGNNNYPARLLELLLAQRKIVFFEIPFDDSIKPSYFS